MGLAVATANTIVIGRGGVRIVVHPGDAWDAADPFVLAHPDLFSDDPAHARRTVAPDTVVIDEGQGDEPKKLDDEGQGDEPKKSDDQGEPDGPEDSDDETSSDESQSPPVEDKLARPGRPSKGPLAGG